MEKRYLGPAQSFRYINTPSLSLAQYISTVVMVLFLGASTLGVDNLLIALLSHRAGDTLLPFWTGLYAIGPSGI